MTNLDETIRPLLPPGYSFGYIGNVYGMYGCPSWRDERSWYIFAPHPDRVGTYEDQIGGFRTDDRIGLVEAAQELNRVYGTMSQVEANRAARVAMNAARRART